LLSEKVKNRRKSVDKAEAKHFVVFRRELNPMLWCNGDNVTKMAS